MGPGDGGERGGIASGRGSGGRRRSRRPLPAKSEVLAHETGDVALGEQLVRPECALDSRDRVEWPGCRPKRGRFRRPERRIPDAECLPEPGGRPERRCPTAAEEARDRRVIDARLLGKLTLRHPARLEMGPQPVAEGRRTVVIGSVVSPGAHVRRVVRISLGAHDPPRQHLTPASGMMTGGPCIGAYGRRSFGCGPLAAPSSGTAHGRFGAGWWDLRQVVPRVGSGLA
jgi:hypothetical protein